MAKLTRTTPGPFTAKEAEEELRAAGVPPVPMPLEEPAPTDSKGLKVPRRLVVRMKGLTDEEAEVTLLDRRKVTLKKPDVATQFVQARVVAGVMPEPPPGGYPDQLVWTIRALMYVAAIDGKAERRPTNVVEAQELMNKLGDEGMEAVSSAFVSHFITREIDLPL